MNNLNQENKTSSQLVNISNVDLLKQLCHINLLVTYPIPDEMLEIWADTIKELEPNLTPEMLKKIIDRFKSDDLVWDYRKGIQNIFTAYKSITYKKPYATLGELNGPIK